MPGKKIALLSAFILLSIHSSAFAVGSGGFENATFSANALGQGNAVVAQADEPAAISYNPAGIADLRGVHTQSSLAGISVVTRHNGRQDGDVKSAGTMSLVPTGYVTINPGVLNERLSIGVGSDSPFGLANKYNANESHVRYTGYVNYLKMFTIKPVAAFKIHDKFSIGGGPMYYRIFDFGGVQAYPNIVAAAQGLTAVTTDGQVRLNLKGNNWGWQMGALAKPHEKHRIGFYFRSPVTVKTRGRIEVERGARGNFTTGGNVKIDLPLNFTIGYAFLPNPKTTIEMDFGFTRWSAHERLYINADPTGSAADDFTLAAIGKADKDYGNGFSLHLGGKRELTDKTKLLLGTLFYWTPVPADHFIPAVPDSNSIAFSAGLQHQVTKHIRADLTYFNRLYLRRTVENGISESLGTTVDGKYFSVLNMFMLTLTYQWDDIFVKSGPEPALSTGEDPVMVFPAAK